MAATPVGSAQLRAGAAAAAAFDDPARRGKTADPHAPPSRTSSSSSSSSTTVPGGVLPRAAHTGPLLLSRSASGRGNGRNSNNSSSSSSSSSSNNNGGGGGGGLPCCSGNANGSGAGGGGGGGGGGMAAASTPSSWPCAMSSSASNSSLPAARKQPSLRGDIAKTLAWIALAALVAALIGVWKGRLRAVEFVTGYIVEYSLSVDNLFVFMLIFKYFRVPRSAQERVLAWGIIGAMALRGIMIVLGKALTERFHWISIGFAVFLLYTAFKLLWDADDDDADLDNNRIIRISKRLLPVADHYKDADFFIFDSNANRLLATPLLVVLISIELSDVVFATDSVPAVLGISSDALVIYASNICAVMGLRSLFFVIADMIGNIRYLPQSLAVVLGFIALKMLAASLFGYELDGVVSLLVVICALAIGIALSLAWPVRKSVGSCEAEYDVEMLSMSGSAERI